jgi:hypothetical protein
MTLEQLRSLRDRALEAMRMWKENPTSPLLEHNYLIRMAAFAQACVNRVEEELRNAR